MKTTFRMCTWAIILIALTITACSGKRYSKVEGVTFVMSRGFPSMYKAIWSPVSNTKVLITASQLGPGKSEVYIFDLAKEKKTILAHTEHGDLVGKMWLSDGEGVIIFVNPGSNGFEKSGCWFAQADGSVLEFLDDVCNYSLGPGGKVLEYDGYLTIKDKKLAEIRLIDEKNNIRKIIFSDETIEDFFGFSWSPDGERITFSAGSTSARDIYVLELKSQTVKKITSDNSNYSPAWSPSGNMIAYVSFSRETLNRTIILVHPSGNCKVEITGLDDVGSPTWSPDGSMLGFVGQDGFYYYDINILIENSELAECK